MLILFATVAIKPNIKRFTKSDVEFDDVEDVDTVVMATGYKVDFPFVEKSIIDVKNNLDLYTVADPRFCEKGGTHKKYITNQ